MKIKIYSMLLLAALLMLATPPVHANPPEKGNYAQALVSVTFSSVNNEKVDNCFAMGPEVAFRYYIPFSEKKATAVALGLSTGILIPFKAEPVINEIALCTGLDTGWEKIRITPYVKSMLLFQDELCLLSVNAGLESRVRLSDRLWLTFGAYARPGAKKFSKDANYATYIALAFNLEKNKD